MNLVPDVERGLYLVYSYLNFREFSGEDAEKSQKVSMIFEAPDISILHDCCLIFEFSIRIPTS